MRKVIVDQIEAAGELNRIVARHGRGLTWWFRRASSPRDEEQPARRANGPMRRFARARARAEASSASEFAAADLGTRQRAARRHAGQPQFRTGTRWMALRPVEPRRHGAARCPARASAVAGVGKPLESLSLDISRLMVESRIRDVGSLSARRGKHSPSALHPAGQKAFDESRPQISRRRTFKQTVDRYITEFERLLDEVAARRTGPRTAAHLTSETGMSIRCSRMRGTAGVGFGGSHNHKTEAAMPPFVFGGSWPPRYRRRISKA